MTREIQLSRGMVALVDDEDYKRISAHRWCAVPRRGGRVYAIRHPGIAEKGTPLTIYMHREVLGVQDGQLRVDHVNRDSLDNRRLNLRIATATENAANSAVLRRSYQGHAFSSRFKGVHFDKQRGAWRARIEAFLGRFESEEEAARAYDRAAAAIHGEFARLNLPSISKAESK